jgi:hypothetical protein
MIYVTNAFSLSMLPAYRRPSARQSVETRLIITPVTNPARFLASLLQVGEQYESAVGHADTAALFSRILGWPVEVRRQSIEIWEGDVVLVGQYSGPRLPEGATELPAGAVIEWYAVRYAPSLTEQVHVGGKYYADEVSAAALAGSRDL